MPRCRVCDNTERKRAEKALANGATLRAVAIKFNLSEDSLQRHWSRHVTDDAKARYIIGPVADKKERLLSASGVMEARGGGFGYDDGSRRSTVAGEHEGFLSSWPRWTQSTSHPCSTTRSASPWCASTAGQRASVALDAAATRWSGTGMTTRSRIGSGIAARRARRALTTAAGQCWPGTTSRCGSGCCASTSWV